MFDEKQLEVYAYVKDSAVEYLPVILQAITDGVKEENQMLREKKSNVECGLLALADKVKLSTLETNMKDVLLRALEDCTFLKMDTFIANLKKEIKK